MLKNSILTIALILLGDAALAFTEDGLMDEPCPLASISSSYVTGVSVSLAQPKKEKEIVVDSVCVEFCDTTLLHNGNDLD